MHRYPRTPRWWAAGACECVAIQEHDGTVTLECLSGPDAPIPVDWMKAISAGSLDATLFKGHLKKGLPVEAKGTLLGRPGGWNRERGTRATFGLTGNSRLTVGSPDEAAEWRFAITNLVFSIPAGGQLGTSHVRSASLTFALLHDTVTIERVRDYEEIE